VVNAHSAEGDASRRCELSEGANALITKGLAIADVKLLTAAGTAEQAGQQRFTGANRAFAHEPLAIAVVGDQLLITSASGQPNWRARSAKSYCRRWLSRLCTT
jgi:hypothetical protein